MPGATLTLHTNRKKAHLSVFIAYRSSSCLVLRWRMAIEAIHTHTKYERKLKQMTETKGMFCVANSYSSNRKTQPEFGKYTAPCCVIIASPSIRSLQPTAENWPIKIQFSTEEKKCTKTEEREFNAYFSHYRLSCPFRISSIRARKI